MWLHLGMEITSHCRHPLCHTSDIGIFLSKMHKQNIMSSRQFIQGQTLLRAFPGKRNGLLVSTIKQQKVGILHRVHVLTRHVSKESLEGMKDYHSPRGVGDGLLQVREQTKLVFRVIVQHAHGFVNVAGWFGSTINKIEHWVLTTRTQKAMSGGIMQCRRR